MKQCKNRFLSAVTAAALAVTALGSIPSVMPAKAAGLTGLDAKGITSQMVIGWNLGNSLDCGDTGYSSNTAPEKFAKAWGQPLPTAELFQTVKDGGFNTVRIPTTWYEHLEWDASTQMYLINDSWMDFVKQTVDYAYDRDMFVILNMHHENFINVGQFSDATYQDASKKLKDIWTQVAEEFKDYDQHLIFEGMNEPRQMGLGGSVEWGTGDTYSRSYVNRLNADFVYAVRSQGSAANRERLLMLPGYCARNEEEAVRAVEIPANAGNVAISVHAYTPYYFAMANDAQANHSFPGKSGWGSDYESELTSMFNYLNRIQNEKGAPVIIGEFSASNFNNTEDRCRWATDYLSKAKAAGIPCVLWDNNVIEPTSNGESHGYINRSNNSWYDASIPVIQSMMKVYEGGTPSLPSDGDYVKPAFDWSQVKIGADWVKLYREENGRTLGAWENFTVSGYQNYLNENYDLVLIYDADTEPELVIQGSDSSWNKIPSGDTSGTKFMLTFTYEDMLNVVNAQTIAGMWNLFISATSGDVTAYALYAAPKHKIEPTEPPTEAPTQAPTEAPTEAPTQAPTEAPTEAPTQAPTEAPTEAPTQAPTETPTEAPTQAPTEAPTQAPTEAPTQAPTEAPTETPTEAPEPGYIPGDTDNNGVVELLDVVKLQKFLLGVKDVKVCKETVDLNGDGKLNVIDLVLLKRLFLNKH